MANDAGEWQTGQYLVEGVKAIKCFHPRMLISLMARVNSNSMELSYHSLSWYPGGALNFFSGRGVRPGFPKCGACELTFASERGACERKISKFGGLWAENFQIWGLVSWKFPNLGACELKFGWKLRLLRLKFPNFLKRGSCELTLLLEMGPLRAAGEAWKGGLQGCTSPYPLSRSVPPPPGLDIYKNRFLRKTSSFEWYN